MDPITAAILAVLPSVAGDTIKQGVKDAYEGLKAVIRRKWGESGQINKAITAVETDKDPKSQAPLLDRTLAAENAGGDAEVMQALKALLDQMKAQGVGGQAAAGISVVINGGTLSGNMIGTSNVSTVNFGKG